MIFQKSVKFHVNVRMLLQKLFTLFMAKFVMKFNLLTALENNCFFFLNPPDFQKSCFLPSFLLDRIENKSQNRLNFFNFKCLTGCKLERQRSISLSLNLRSDLS